MTFAAVYVRKKCLQVLCVYICAYVRPSIYEIAFLPCGCVLGEEILKLHCRHCYHTACVMGWLEGHNTCPMCRHQMPKEEDEKDKQRNVEAVNSFFG